MKGSCCLSVRRHLHVRVDVGRTGHSDDANACTKSLRDSNEYESHGVEESQGKTQGQLPNVIAKAWQLLERGDRGGGILFARCQRRRSLSDAARREQDTIDENSAVTATKITQGAAQVCDAEGNRGRMPRRVQGAHGPRGRVRPRCAQVMLYPLPRCCICLSCRRPRVSVELLQRGCARVAADTTDCAFLFAASNLFIYLPLSVQCRLSRAVEKQLSRCRDCRCHGRNRRLALASSVAGNQRLCASRRWPAA